MSGRFLVAAAAVAAAGMAVWQWWRSHDDNNNNNNNNNNISSQTNESSNDKSNNVAISSSSSSSSSSTSSSSSSSIAFPSTSFLTNEYHMSPGIITCSTLAQLLSHQMNQSSSSSRVIVLDASWWLPQVKRDPEAEFRTYRIYGASFWNIDTCADTSSGYLPHMLPSTSLFEATCYQVGIRSAQDRIVIYDTSGAFCGSARLWWNFRCFGWPADRIHVLHGGMKEMVQKYPEWIERTPYKQKETEEPRLNRWHARFIPSWYRSKHDLLHTLSTSPSPPEIIIDARDRNRYLKIDDEPRPIKYRGHIPGAKHLFHASLIMVSTQQQRLKSRQEMEAIFKECLGFSISSPPSPTPILVTYCGSGVTAATVSWALSLLGYPEDCISLYDGSWAEWGNDDHVPIE